MTRRKEWLAGLSAAVISNLVSFGVSAVMVLLAPKFLTVEEYGGFQLYLFYSGYVGFANFGWPEGILLKWGGQPYDRLDHPGLKTQFGLFSLMSVLLAAGIGLVGSRLGAGWLWLGIGCCTMLALPGNFLQVLLHSTGRTQAYARGILVEKAVYLTAAVLMLAGGWGSAPRLVGADLLGRLALLACASWANRRMLRSRAAKVMAELPGIWENITAGIKLMLANLAGLFQIGIIRQCIQMYWSVAVFGKVSLTLSLSNMLLVVIRAVSVVLFPMLKTSPPEKLKNLYRPLRLGTTGVLLVLLGGYFPMGRLLTLWLPQYADSIRYGALLLPICLYECRMSMLTETYLKALRMERTLLQINGSCVILSGLLGLGTVLGLHSLELALLAMVLVAAVRCGWAEMILQKRLGQAITDWKDTFLAAAFVVFHWCIGGLWGWGLYLAALTGYGLKLAAGMRKRNGRSI